MVMESLQLLRSQARFALTTNPNVALHPANSHWCVFPPRAVLGYKYLNVEGNVEALCP